MPHCQICNQARDCALEYSITDKHCGVCGLAIRAIRSPQQAGELDEEGRDVAWIYPTSDSSEYRLTLTMEHGNAAGRIESNQPLPLHVDAADDEPAEAGEPGDEPPADGGPGQPADAQQPAADGRGQSDAAAGILGSALCHNGTETPIHRVDAGNPTTCVLPMLQDIPKQGLPGNLRLVGDFGVEEIRVLLCRAPRFQLHMTREHQDAANVRKCGYVREERREGRNVPVYQIHVWKKGHIEFKIQVSANTAPVLCSGLTRVTRHDAGIEFIPHHWNKLKPGIPQELRFSVDFSDFEPGEQRYAEIVLPLHSVPLGSSMALKPFHFCFVWDDIGDLRFTPRNLHQRELRWGQSLQTQIVVENIGAAEIGGVAVHSSQPWIRIDANSLFIPGFPGSEAEEESQQTIKVVIDSDKISRDQHSRLDGTITLQEQEEHSRRTWEIPVSIDVLVDPDPLDAVLAVDFGSANSCVAYARWEEDVRPLPLNQLANAGAGDAEVEIPSAIYFHNVRPKEHPAVTIGNEAYEAAGLPMGTLVAEAPAPEQVNGLVEDAKRWIGENRRFTVFDIRGQRESFTAEEIVALSIRELIDRARQTYAIHKVEFSFPTKFTRKQKQAYLEILKKLQRHYSGFSRVQLTHDKDRQLRLDEASAAAIAFLYDQHEQTQDRFVLVTIDWGGGTFDHCVMELERIRDDRSGRFRTTYRGLGGDTHLGGNDVTYAVVSLLRSRLTERLREMAQQSGFQDIELETIDIPFCWPSEEVASKTALKNFHLLWMIADRLKIALSNKVEDDSVSVESSLPPKLVRDVIGEIDVQLFDPILKGPAVVTFADLETNMSGVMAALAGLVYQMKLEEVYKVPLTHQTRVDSLDKRLASCLRQIKRQLEVAGVEEFEVLLAGAASRLPILSSLIRKILGKQVPIHKNPELAKRRVANGLAIYAKVTDVTDRFFGEFASPLDVLADGLGVMTVRGASARAHFIPIIPAGTFWHTSAVFEFPFAEQTWQRRTIGGATFFRAYALFSGSTRKLVGAFDLESGEFPETDPYDLPADCTGRLRIDGPGDIKLQVEIGGTTYGWFQFNWDTNDIWN